MAGTHLVNLAHQDDQAGDHAGDHADDHADDHAEDQNQRSSPALRSVGDQAEDQAEDQASSLGIGTTAALDEHGYQAVVAALKERFGYLKVAADREVMASSPHTDMPEDVLLATKETADMAAWTQADEPGAGTTAALDEHGYQEVVVLKDVQQMEFFARRLISKMGLRVKDQGGLRGLIAYHNGESAKQTFKTLEEEIKISGGKHVWVTNLASGASAPLNQGGYGEIVTQISSREMVEFVRRVVSDLGLKVTDEAGLAGLAKWYSGDKAVQTFLDLQGELISASKINGSWITNSAPCPGTHPSEEALDEIQNATRWGNNASASVALSSQDKYLSEEELEESEKAEIQNSTRWAGNATVPLSSEEKLSSEEGLDDMQSSTRWAKNAIVPKESSTGAGEAYSKL